MSEKTETKAIRVSYTSPDTYWLDVEGRRSITIKDHGPHSLPQAFNYDGLVYGVISHLLMDRDLPLYRLEIKDDVPIEPMQRMTLDALVELHNQKRSQEIVLDDVRRATYKEREAESRSLV